MLDRDHVVVDAITLQSALSVSLPTTVVINTIVGTGTAGAGGDSGKATSAQLYAPSSVAVDISGKIYIADYVNQKIRLISTSGIMSTYAGTGNHGFSGDTGRATSAQLWDATGVGPDISGNVYIADFSNMRIRMVNSAGNTSHSYTK